MIPSSKHFRTHLRSARRSTSCEHKTRRPARKCGALSSSKEDSPPSGRGRSSSKTKLLSWSGSVAVLCLACTAAQSPPPTASKNEEPKRRVPGVALDPSLTPPRALPVQDTGKVLLALETPEDPRRALRTIESFFSAMLQSDLLAIEALLHERAWFRGSGGRQRARDHYRIRLSRYDYTSLGPIPIYRLADTEIYRATDLYRIRPRRRMRLSPSGQEVLVKITILRPRIAQRRLFGDEITFLLAPEGANYLITEIQEDFQLP